MDDDEDIDPNQYFERRVQHVAAEKSAGRNPYPHKFAVSHRILDFVAEFSGLDAGSQQQETTVSIAGAGVQFVRNTVQHQEMLCTRWERKREAN